MRRRVNWSNKNDDYVTTFINKQEMEYEFYQSWRQGCFTERAGELILTLVENICFSKSFELDSSEFIIREAMIDSVVMYILENGLRLYKPDKSAFGYFSMTVFSKAYDFLRSRYGVAKRFDLYGERIKYRVDSKEWIIYSVSSIEEFDSNQKEYILNSDNYYKNIG